MKDIINMISYVLIIACVVMLVIIAGSVDCESMEFETAVYKAIKWLAIMVFSVLTAILTGAEND